MGTIFDSLAFSSDTPIFVQVVAHIKRNIVAGHLQDGDTLPSRRRLAVLLGINPNTVQKIYKQLEDEGLLLNSQGAKSVLHLTKETRIALQGEFVGQELRKTLASLKESGVPLDDVLALTVQLWQADEKTPANE